MDLLGALPGWSDVLAFAREFGPAFALLGFAVFVQARQNAAHQRAQAEQNAVLLDGLLGGLKEVREAQRDAAVQQAAAVAELKGIRADLVKTEARLQGLAERQGAHAETISAHGARLAEHERRIVALEGRFTPPGAFPPQAAAWRADPD